MGKEMKPKIINLTNVKVGKKHIDWTNRPLPPKFKVIPKTHKRPDIIEMSKRHMEKATEKHLLKKVFESKDNADLDKYHTTVLARQNRRLAQSPRLAERVARRVDRKVALHEKERQAAMADPQIRKSISERNERRMRDAGRASGISEMINASGHVVKTPDGPIMYHRDKQKDSLEFAKANKPGSLERKMALSIAKMHGSEKRGMLRGSLAQGTAESTVHGGGGGKRFDAITFRGNQWTAAQVDEAAYSARQNVLDTLNEEGRPGDGQRERELMDANLSDAADRARIPEDVLREHLGWPTRAEQAKMDAQDAESARLQKKMDRAEAKENKRLGLPGVAVSPSSGKFDAIRGTANSQPRVPAGDPKGGQWTKK